MAYMIPPFPHPMYGGGCGGGGCSRGSSCMDLAYGYGPPAMMMPPPAPPPAYYGSSCHSDYYPPSRMRHGSDSTPSYLWLSLFACLCCCMPMGLAGILFALQSRSRKDMGNYEAAEESSDRALCCSAGAIIIGAILLIVVGVLLYLYYTGALDSLFA